MFFWKTPKSFLPCTAAGLLGDFLAVAQRAILVLAETCQLVQTHFLSCSCKKENALQKKEDAQGKPQGFP